MQEVLDDEKHDEEGVTRIMVEVSSGLFLALKNFICNSEPNAGYRMWP